MSIFLFYLVYCIFYFEQNKDCCRLDYRGTKTRYCSLNLCLPIFAGILSVAEIAQLGERQTEDLKVPGSNPESSYEL